METGNCWKEKDWQEHVNTLLAIHHSITGGQYITVPDKVLGDGGLEGFSSNGYAYQSYADQGSVSTKDRAQKQRGKISDDIPKLKKYEAQWKKLLQRVKLRFWVLVVPILEDKSVQAHAREAGEKLRKLGLSFIGEDFQALAQTDKQFVEAYRRATELGCAKIRLEHPDIDESDHTQFIKKQSNLVSTLDGKLKRMLPRSPDERSSARKELLEWYLRGSNLMDQLRHDAPWLWQPIKMCIDTMAQSIRTTGHFDSAAPKARLLAAKEKLFHELNILAGKALHSNDLESVTWSAVTQWLLECPLNFPEVRNA